jgi:hypothetical protein
VYQNRNYDQSDVEEYNHFLHLTGVSLRSTPSGEKYVGGNDISLKILKEKNERRFKKTRRFQFKRTDNN